MVKLSRPGLLAACLGLSSLLSVTSLALVGCDGEEASSTDSTPPDHIIKAPKSQGKYRFGVTDTIAVEFDENVDTAGLKLEFSTTGAASHILSRRKAVLFGTKTSLASVHFPVNVPFTLTLRGVTDPVGNGRPDIEESFLPYPWTDRDMLDTTYDWYDSLYNGQTWIDGTPVSDTLLTEGGLDYRVNFGRVDRLDYKVVRLGGLDTLDLFLTTRKDLNLRMVVAGPFKPEGFDDVLKEFNFDGALNAGDGTKILSRDSTAATGRISKNYVTILKDHRTVMGSFDAVGLYVIRLGVPEEKEGFYRMGLRIRKLL